MISEVPQIWDTQRLISLDQYTYLAAYDVHLLHTNLEEIWHPRLNDKNPKNLQICWIHCVHGASIPLATSKISFLDAPLPLCPPGNSVYFPHCTGCVKPRWATCASDLILNQKRQKEATLTKPHLNWRTEAQGFADHHVHVLQFPAHSQKSSQKNFATNHQKSPTPEVIPFWHSVHITPKDLAFFQHPNECFGVTFMAVSTLHNFSSLPKLGKDFPRMRGSCITPPPFCAPPTLKKWDSSSYERIELFNLSLTWPLPKRVRREQIWSWSRNCKSSGNGGVHSDQVLQSMLTS